MVKIRSLQSLKLWNHGNLCGKRMLKMKILEGPGKKEKKKNTIFWVFGSSNSNIWIILLSSDIETKFGTWNWFQVSKTPFLKILVVKFGTKMNFQNFWTLSKIYKLSPAKRHQSLAPNPRTKKAYCSLSGLQRFFFKFFFTLGIPDTPNAFSHYWERSCPNFVKAKVNG